VYALERRETPESGMTIPGDRLNWGDAYYVEVWAFPQGGTEEDAVRSDLRFKIEEEEQVTPKPDPPKLPPLTLSITVDPV
jgi:hypothetical protein